MNAKSPEQGVGAGAGDAGEPEGVAGDPDGEADGPGHGVGVGGTNVMSNVRSSPGGLALDCERSVYLQVLG